MLDFDTVDISNLNRQILYTVKEQAVKMEPRVEAKYNPFDAPVPGQSLTDTPGNAPWEHPPQM